VRIQVNYTDLIFSTSFSLFGFLLTTLIVFRRGFTGAAARLSARSLLRGCCNQRQADLVCGIRVPGPLHAELSGQGQHWIGVRGTSGYEGSCKRMRVNVLPWLVSVRVYYPFSLFALDSHELMRIAVVLFLRERVFTSPFSTIPTLQVQKLHVAAAAMRDAHNDLLEGTAHWDLAKLTSGLEAVAVLTAEWGDFCDPAVSKRLIFSSDGATLA